MAIKQNTTTHGRSRVTSVPLYALPLTLLMRVKVDDVVGITATTEYFGYYGGPAGGGEWEMIACMISNSNDKLGTWIAIGGDTNSKYPSGSAVVDGTEYTYGIVWESATLTGQSYIDGVASGVTVAPTAGADTTWDEADRIALFQHWDGGGLQADGTIYEFVLVQEEWSAAQVSDFHDGYWPFAIATDPTKIIAMYVGGSSLGTTDQASLLYDYSGRGYHQVVQAGDVEFVAHSTALQFPREVGDSVDQTYADGGAYSKVAIPTNHGLVRVVISGTADIAFSADKAAASPDIEPADYVQLAGGPKILCCGAYTHLHIRENQTTDAGAGKANITGLLAPQPI